MVVVSVTPEIALEEINCYAGGLGVLEGDKFIEASKNGFKYFVLTLLYKKGYVDYYITDDGNIIAKPQKHPIDLTKFMKAEEEFVIKIRGENVYTRPWIYTKGRAKVVFFEATCPLWLRQATERVYIEKDEESRIYKWIFLAKASAKYIKEFIGLDSVDVIDLNEAYASLLVYALPEYKNFRLIVHTPGPWGHPYISSQVLEEEFGVKIKHDSEMITRLALERVSKAYAVSRKHYEVTKILFPEFVHKFSYVTNGVSIDRWRHHVIRDLVASKGLENISSEDLWRTHLKIKKELIKDLLKIYKPGLEIDETTPIAVWCRRIVRYKRPYFITWFIEDIGRDLDVVFVIGGKPHPDDRDGLHYTKKFLELSKKYDNVVFIHDYDISKAKLLLSGCDIHLFTPFPGWEACGTSYMKAALNGVPTLSSRDGGALEFIVDGVNGWFFGSEINEFINIYSDTRVNDIDKVEYEEFSEKLVDILKSYGSIKYKEIALNVLKTSERFSIKRVLSELYKPINENNGSVSG